MELYETLLYSLIAFTIMYAAGYFIPYMYKKSSVEHYRDPIWMNKKKMYDDWYPRSNGSIYGTFVTPYDMFTGYPTFPKAY